MKIKSENWTYLSISEEGEIIIYNKPFTLSPIKVMFHVEVFDGKDWIDANSFSDLERAKKDAQEYLKLGYIGHNDGYLFTWRVNGPKVLEVRIVKKTTLRRKMKTGQKRIIFNPKHPNFVDATTTIREIVS